MHTELPFYFVRLQYSTHNKVKLLWCFYLKYLFWCLQTGRAWTKHRRHARVLDNTAISWRRAHHERYPATTAFQLWPPLFLRPQHTDSPININTHCFWHLKDATSLLCMLTAFKLSHLATCENCSITTSLGMYIFIKTRKFRRRKRFPLTARSLPLCVNGDARHIMYRPPLLAIPLPCRRKSNWTPANILHRICRHSAENNGNYNSRSSLTTWKMFGQSIWWGAGRIGSHTFFASFNEDMSTLKHTHAPKHIRPRLSWHQTTNTKLTNVQNKYLQMRILPHNKGRSPASSRLPHLLWVHVWIYTK